MEIMELILTILMAVTLLAVVNGFAYTNKRLSQIISLLVDVHVKLENFRAEHEANEAYRDWATDPEVMKRREEENDNDRMEEQTKRI
jgi:hypothetical protein